MNPPTSLRPFPHSRVNVPPTHPELNLNYTGSLWGSSDSCWAELSPGGLQQHPHRLEGCWGLRCEICTCELTFFGGVHGNHLSILPQLFTLRWTKKYGIRLWNSKTRGQIISTLLLRFCIKWTQENWEKTGGKFTVIRPKSVNIPPISLTPKMQLFNCSVSLSFYQLIS